jgi:Anti-sigma-K factor rskA
MADHAGPHRDVAAWVMGRLERDAARAFESHMRGCARCRDEAAELDALPRLLEQAAPRWEVPAGLEERVFAALPGERAAPRRRFAALRSDGRPAPARRRLPRLAWAGAAVAAAAVAAVVVLGRGDDAAVQRFALRSTVGEQVDVRAEVRVTPVGREVELDIRRLRDPRPEGIYELWFVAPGDTRARPRRVPAGTFHPDERGRGTVRLVAAAEPSKYPRLSVTLEPADGNPARTGPEVLRP